MAHKQAERDLDTQYSQFILGILKNAKGNDLERNTSDSRMRTADTCSKILNEYYQQQRKQIEKAIKWVESIKEV